ncbi:MAG: hypothetical protein LC676_15535 [Loktanella sp.]|nr:hypothetical protein [Loktanella sp.]
MSRTSLAVPAQLTLWSRDMRVLIPFLALAACSEFPAFDTTIDAATRAAPPPDLVPLDPLLAVADRPSTITPASVARTDGRAAALRDRAAGLRGQVLSDPDRARLNQSIDTSALR